MALPTAAQIREALYTDLQKQAYIDHTRNALGAYILDHKGELNSGENIAFTRTDVPRIKNISENMHNRLWSDTHALFVTELKRNGFNVDIRVVPLDDLASSKPSDGYKIQWLVISID